MIVNGQKNKKSIVHKFILFIIVFSLAFFFSFLVSDDKIENLLSNLPNILGILLAGVLASLSILYGLLSDADLLRIRKRNLNRIKKQEGKDRFLVFLDSVKEDTIIIFCSFVISYVLTILINIDFSKMSTVIGLVPGSLLIDSKFYLLAIGLSVFILSISCAYDIIESVFILNKERYESSDADSDEN